MALQPCPDCGKQLGTRADECPNCGRRLLFGGLEQMLGAQGILFVFLLYFVFR